MSSERLATRASLGRVVTMDAQRPRHRGAVLLRRKWLLPAAAFAIVSGIVTCRIMLNLNVPGQPSAPYYAYMDFRDAFYYPAVALLDGNNPYLASEYLRTYSVMRPFSPYPPLVMLVHLPFAMLPIQQAEILYHTVNLGLLVLLAYLTLRLIPIAATAERILWLSTLLLLSHPVHMSLFLGQCTLYVVVGTYLALLFPRTRPWLAAAGFAVTCLKPTFGIPLGIVLLVRRDWATAIRGSIIAAVASVPASLMLIRAAGGIGPLLASFQESYAFHANAAATAPASSFIRLDTPAFFGRLFVAMGSRSEMIVTLGVLALGTLAVWRVTRGGDDGRRLSNGLICLTMLAALYHAAYDGMLLALPATAVVLDRWPRLPGAAGRRLRLALVALFAVPALNYAATATVIQYLDLKGIPWLVVNSLNGGAVLLAFGLYVGVCLAYPFEQSQITAGVRQMNPEVGA